MTEMIERATQAAYSATMSADPACSAQMAAKMARPVALAVIEAMREPTEKMKLAQFPHMGPSPGYEIYPDEAADVWRSMINTALDETKEKTAPTSGAA